MDRLPPYRFENLQFVNDLGEQITSIGDSGEAKVRVFSKYENRNGSYITDEVAEQLIQSAIDVPIIGLFDHNKKDWTGHVGPGLANGYGYCKEFLGWEPYLDTDGVVRDYAVFKVKLFSNYFEEAATIIGKSQSMELNPATITGEWGIAPDTDNEVYIYKTAKMHGFCVLGDDREPCFSNSKFFEKKNLNEWEKKFEEVSFEISKLQEQVNLLSQGGNKMDNELKENVVFENDEEKLTDDEEVVAEATEDSAETETETESEAETEAEFSSEKDKEEDQEDVDGNVSEEDNDDYACGDKDKKEAECGDKKEDCPLTEDAECGDKKKKYEVEIGDTMVNLYESPIDTAVEYSISLDASWSDKYNSLTSTYADLQVNYNTINTDYITLQSSYEDFSTKLEEAEKKIEAYEVEKQNYEATIAELKQTIANYEQKEKQAILDKFSKCLPADIMQPIIDGAAEMSINDLNTRCAVEYTNFSMAKQEEPEIRIPHVSNEEPALYAILQKYKK